MSITIDQFETFSMKDTDAVLDRMYRGERVVLRGEGMQVTVWYSGRDMLRFAFEKRPTNRTTYDLKRRGRMTAEVLESALINNGYQLLKTLADGRFRPWQGVTSLHLWRHPVSNNPSSRERKWLKAWTERTMRSVAKYAKQAELSDETTRPQPHTHMYPPMRYWS